MKKIVRLTERDLTRLVKNVINEGMINETYQDLLTTMEVFQEPLNDMDTLIEHLKNLEIDGVDSQYIKDTYAKPINELYLELLEIQRNFTHDETMWQSKGKFRDDSEKHFEKLISNMRKTQDNWWKTHMR